MKTFEDFNIDGKEVEKLFLELSHIDELEIKFDFIEYEYDLYYIYKDECLFDQEKRYNYFYINVYKIWLIFEKKVGLNHEETKDILSVLVNKYFKLDGYTAEHLFLNIIDKLNNHFKY